MLVTTFSLPSLSLDVFVSAFAGKSQLSTFRGSQSVNRRSSLCNQLIMGFNRISQFSLKTVLHSFAVSQMTSSSWKNSFCLFSSWLCVLVWLQCWLSPCANYKVKTDYSLSKMVRKEKRAEVHQCGKCRDCIYLYIKLTKITSLV